MSARVTRRRGRPPKALSLNRPQKFQYHLLKKPKYLLNREGKDSEHSTPSQSRDGSPEPDHIPRSSRPTRKPRGKYGPRSGSGRRGGKSSAPSRLYYNLTTDRQSDYHYGSDFDDDSDASEREAPKSDSELDEPLETLSIQSESSYSSDIPRNKLPYSRPPSPEPLWLQQLNLPHLELPASSQDLLVPNNHTMQTLSIYEVLRHFRNLARLSPFRLEDFCGALMTEDQNILLCEVHIMLLKAIFREEESQQTHFGPLDQKDSVNICIFFNDPMTWPEVLRAYVESDKSFDEEVGKIVSSGSYPFVSVDKRLIVLQFLTDQFLTTNPVREDLIYEGNLIVY